MLQRSHLTELVIRQHHDKLDHTCTSRTWFSLQQRFWIVKGPAAVRIVKCIKRKTRSASVGKQLMADLPSCRLQIDKPSFFYKVGVDSFWLSKEKAALKDMGAYFHA